MQYKRCSSNCCALHNARVEPHHIQRHCGCHGSMSRKGSASLSLSLSRGSPLQTVGCSAKAACCQRLGRTACLAPPPPTCHSFEHDTVWPASCSRTRTASLSHRLRGTRESLAAIAQALTLCSAAARLSLAPVAAIRWAMPDRGASTLHTAVRWRRRQAQAEMTVAGSGIDGLLFDCERVPETQSCFGVSLSSRHQKPLM